MNMTTTRKIIALLLILAVLFGYLLTPLGLEPRTADLRTIAIVPFFITASLGIPIIATILLFIKPKITGILVIVNAIIMLFLVAGDQGGFFFTTPPPTAITLLEFLSIIVSIGFLLYGPKLYNESKSAHLK
ncbi:MAG TPA: hypothetical protein VK502_02580 [Candidatus Saccharimonadales bacterium]|nr:hypothetical protein [Candidatus Saccharimonadales bacterium]